MAYSQGLDITVGSVATNPHKGTLELHRSLADGSTCAFTVRGLRADLTHVERGAEVEVEDAESSTLLFSGHVLNAIVESHGGSGTLIDVAVDAAADAQQLYRKTLTSANARDVNLADTASDQLDELVTVAGSDYSAGTVHANVPKVVGTGPGTTVGHVLRQMGDVPIVQPDGEIDLQMRAGLTSAATVNQEHVDRDYSHYRVDLDTEVGRVIAIGADVRFIASGTLDEATVDGVTLSVATITPPANTEVRSVDRVIARQNLTGKFDEGDLLDGVWDPDHNHFEWSGVLGAGEQATVELHGVWQSEIEVEASMPSALAGDAVINVPITGQTEITAAANRELARQRQPVELMTLPLVFGNTLARIAPGEAVKCSLALQQELNVHQPVASDLWLVQGDRITQPGSSQAVVTLLLSRRLPDYRNRDFWSREDMTGSGGRQIVIGGGTGAPQIALVIPAQSIFTDGDDLTLDLGSYFSDPDGDMLTYAATSSDTSVATVAVSGDTLTISPTSMAGSATVTVTASDQTRSTAQIFSVTSSANRAPISDSTIADRRIMFSSEIDLDDHFSDPDGDDLTFTASSSDTALATTAVSGSVLTVTAVAGGAPTITVTATDPGGLTAQQTFTATVTPRAGPITIGAGTRPNTQTFRWTFATRPEIGAAASTDLFADQTVAYYLDRLQITNSASQDFELFLSDSAGAGGDLQIGFTDTWESTGLGAIILNLDGTDYQFGGPTSTGANPSDAEPAYRWRFPASTDQSRPNVTAFRVAYSAADAATRDAITVRFVSA